MNAEWITGPGRPLTRFGERPLFREGLYRLGGGRTYAWMVPNGSWGETNIGLIDCGGKSVLIDTCWDLTFTREMLAAAGAIVQRSPVEYVVNTHADGDHCWGNSLFPDAGIIASHACIHQMQHLQPNALLALGLTGRLLKSLPASSVSRFGHYMHHMFQPYDFGSVRLVTATLGFSGQKVVTVNGVDIVLYEVGPGHTDGDTIVYVPSERVLYAADILFIRATPVMWAGPVENLVAGLKRLLGFDAAVYVPGHGPLAERHDIQLLIDYWEFIQEALHRCMTLGMTPLEAAKDVVFSRAFQASPFAAWDSPERIVTNAFTLYRGWGASLPPLPGNLGVMNIMRLQAELAFELPQATPRIMRRF